MRAGMSSATGAFLRDIVAQLRQWGIRPSIFVSTDLRQIEAAAEVGTARIELYTEPYAAEYVTRGPEEAIAPFRRAAETALAVGLELNAGHDLSLTNLQFFAEQIPSLAEVSIGHALISDALYLGLQETHPPLPSLPRQVEPPLPFILVAPLALGVVYPMPSG